MTPYEKVANRSGGNCEAMILINTSTSTSVWSRCGRSPIQMHHMLTRARGGEALDRVDEVYHLVALCPRCHQQAHEERSSKLIIDGYVEENGDGTVTYVGDDPYLREKYGVKENSSGTH